jgi:HEPN domain-containing protein/predicted nucleotidyltransferase
MRELIDISNNIKNKIKDLKVMDIISIAIFGSSARNGEYTGSDIDLLVVAEGMSDNVIQRIPDIVMIKRTFNLSLPLDILLVSKDECQSNFRNHNPLYLDIAIDGKIIYDTGFLEALITETKEYISSNSIRHGDGAWSFPVEDRTITYLSRVSNKEWALSWLADGKRDLLAASHLLNAALYEKSVYHCQQAVEKAIKAILAAWGEFRKSHFVAEILRSECENRELSEWEEKLLKIADIGDSTEPQVSLCRYPRLVNDAIWRPYEKYNEGIAKEYIKNARFAIEISGEFIEWWFR